MFIEPSEENAGRTMAALRAFGYDVSDLTVEDLLQKKVFVRQYIVPTDLHPFVRGVLWRNVWANRVESVLGGTPVSFASLDDLIRMKRAAGRPKDVEDLRVLEPIRELGSEG